MKSPTRTSYNAPPVEHPVQSKSIDYLICDPNTFKPLLAVEVDDRFHNQPRRKERDDCVNTLMDVTALPILRWPVTRINDANALEDAIDAALA